MTVDELLEKLRKQREQIEYSISVIESALVDNSISIKRKKIVDAIKKKHHNGLHWTQKPENKERLLAMLKRAAKTRASKRV